MEKEITVRFKMRFVVHSNLNDLSMTFRESWDMLNFDSILRLSFGLGLGLYEIRRFDGY